MSEENTLFPIFLKLKQLNVLIVGGGNVALEKLEALLKNEPEARVVIVAPEISAEILAYERKGQIELIHRSFRFTDLHEVEIAILATDNPELHQLIRKEASRYRVLLNVADTPDLCDFYLGSTVKRGNLKIGISTNGKSPTLAKRIRQVLEETLPHETNELLNNLKKIRDSLAVDFNGKIRELNRITKSLVE